MRVAVHHPARTEEDGTEVEASVAAYRLGRIDDFTNPLTGETTPKQQVAEHLLTEAQAEFPDLQVEIQHLVNDDESGETSSWQAQSEPENAPPGGVASGVALTVEQAAAAGGGEAQ